MISYIDNGCGSGITDLPFSSNCQKTLQPHPRSRTHKIIQARSHKPHIPILTRDTNFDLTMSQSISFQTATSIGLTLCAIFAGGNLTISSILVPSLLLASPSAKSQPESEVKTTTSNQSIQPVTDPSHIARQWQYIYNIGSAAGPVAALGGAASFLYAIRKLPASSIVEPRLLVAAAVLCVAVIPFTLLFMIRTNNELHKRANAATAGEEPKIDGTAAGTEGYQTPELVRWWAKLNLM